MKLRAPSIFALVAACGGSPASPPTTTPSATLSAAPFATPQSDTVMSTFETNGYELSGAEYWPYAGSEDIKYPEEVLWGFYPKQGEVPPGETDPNPASADPKAIECAGRSYQGLQTFLASNNPTFRRVVEFGVAAGTMVPRFYLWTNDYQRAASPYPPGVREARLWWWARKQPEPPKPPGYWKWEASLTQDGVCHVPETAQIETYLSDMLATLEAR